MHTAGACLVQPFYKHRFVGLVHRNREDTQQLVSHTSALFVFFKQELVCFCLLLFSKSLSADIMSEGFSLGLCSLGEWLFFKFPACLVS